MTLQNKIRSDYVTDCWNARRRLESEINDLAKSIAKCKGELARQENPQLSYADSVPIMDEWERRIKAQFDLGLTTCKNITTGMGI